jgi:hypothetical protein
MLPGSIFSGARGEGRGGSKYFVIGWTYIDVQR